jgi:hypothetical protein
MSFNQRIGRYIIDMSGLGTSLICIRHGVYKPDISSFGSQDQCKATLDVFSINYLPPFQNNPVSLMQRRIHSSKIERRRVVREERKIETQYKYASLFDAYHLKAQRLRT